MDSPSPSSSSTSSSRLVSRPTRGPWRRDLLAELAQQRAGGVDVSRRLEHLEGAQRRARLRDRELGVAVAAGPGQVEPAQGRLQRQLGLGEPVERVAQPGLASRPVPARPFASATSGVRVRRGVRLGARLELPDRLVAGPGRRRAGRRPARRAAGCTSCWPGRRSARRAGAGRGRARLSPRARCSAARTLLASGSSRPSSRLAASSYRPCLTRRSASRISAPALRVRRPSAHSRTASVSVASASGQRPAAVRMPP